MPPLLPHITPQPNTHDGQTEEALVGKCFGLTHMPEVASAAACRDHCCSLGAECTTWQFQAGEGGRGCVVGGPVRLGLELADTGAYGVADGGACKWANAP